MSRDFYINELRIPLDFINSLQVEKYVTQRISSRRKRYMEIALAARCGRVALFDGNALFSIQTLDEEPMLLEDVLRQQDRHFSKQNLETITLGLVPQRVIERLMFAIIARKAQSASYFVAYPRALFRMHNQPDKLAFEAAHFGVVVEDNYLKIYPVATTIGLINVENTIRDQYHDVRLVRICKFRGECPIWKTDGRCKFAFPDAVGYYHARGRASDLMKPDRDSYYRAYEGCPFIEEHGDTLVHVKASLKATNTIAFPAFVLDTRLSKADIKAHGISLDYRDATLLESSRRYSRTARVIEAIFEQGESFKVNDLEIPLQVLFYRKASPVADQNAVPYQITALKDQPICTNQQSRRGAIASGGWLFQRDGSYDRNDVDRPFDTIHPFVIVPNLPRAVELAEQLLMCMSDGSYSKKPRQKTMYEDTDFLGLNDPANKTKYNVQLTRLKNGDPGFHVVEPTDVSYQSVAQHIKLEWLAAKENDPSRIVLIVLPEEKQEREEDNPLYYKLKRIFIEDGMPTQFINYDTLKGLTEPDVPFGHTLWTLFLDMYVKLGGKPWRLAGGLQNVNCFIGVGFALSPRATASSSHIYTGVANVFDRYGNWLDITTAYQPLSEEDKSSFESRYRFLQGTASFKISEAITKEIVSTSLDLYAFKQTVARRFPKNIVFHKMGEIYECEVEGFLQAVQQKLGTLENCRLGIVAIRTNHNIRLYGPADMFYSKDRGQRKHKRTSRVVARGSCVFVNDYKSVLATTGRIYREKPTGVINRYSGIGTPRPLIVQRVLPSMHQLQAYKCNEDQFYTIQDLTSHVLALTQLHWGSFREDIRLPISTLYAKKVADIVSKSGVVKIESRMGLHRPWFI